MDNNKALFMWKRGQIELATTIIVGVIILSSFLYVSESIISENRYVGDSNLDLYYDLKTCKTKHLSPDELVKFSSKQEAEENGYKPAPCVE